MKKLPIIFMLMLLVACSKTDATNENAGSGAGVGVTPTPTSGIGFTIWQLTALSVDDVMQPLTGIQMKFQMTLSLNGTYSDTDGIKGTWFSPTSDSLIVSQTNLPTAITTGYKIKIHSTANLKLSKSVNNRQIDLSYESH